MKTKTIVTLMIMLSMLVIGTAEEGTFEIEDTLDGNAFDVSVDYNADIGVYRDITMYDGNYDIKGTADMYDKTYKADFDAQGEIWVTEKTLMTLNTQVDGKIYQTSEPGHLYKDKDNDVYGYVEIGYNAKGEIHFCKNTGSAIGGDYLRFNDFSFDEYSKYVITKTVPRDKFTLSSPALGLGYKGSVMGDVIPALFTYRDPNTGKRVVSETYPVDHDGPVICTPARIAGEPLISADFWDTPKELRKLEWKANHAR